ncbi:MAG: ribosome biogenesis GTP-binding protein YihA/YsxC [Christensenellaceae bacterium]|jgi:GTP-binding protein
MQIRSAKFIKSLTKDFEAFNDTLPEIAVVGKSNVGKSSLINFLTNNSKLAKVAKTPGKTRLVNYFLLNDAFYLVDLPGYGYAKVSKSEQVSWDEMMGVYFESAPMLQMIFILIDIRRTPAADDRAMIDLADYYGIPYVILATKADKVAKSKRKQACDKLRLAIAHPTCMDVIPVSAYDKVGKEQILTIMERYVKEEDEME